MKIWFERPDNAMKRLRGPMRPGAQHGAQRAAGPLPHSSSPPPRPGRLSPSRGSQHRARWDPHPTASCIIDADPRRGGPASEREHTRGIEPLGRFNLFKMFIHMKIVFLYIKSFILLLCLLSKWVLFLKKKKLYFTL